MVTQDITTPCMRALIKLAGITLGKRYGNTPGIATPCMRALIKLAGVTLGEKVW